MQLNYNISEISSADYEQIEQLAKCNGGNVNLNASYINHWYNENPSRSVLLYKVCVGDVIEGYATTNNFEYTLLQNKMLAAMPQNLLTSKRIRGRGLFGELYKKLEAENHTRHKVDCFIVFSNAMSTPIFLKKFDYLKAQCPLVYFYFFNPVNLLKQNRYRELSSLTEIDFNLIRNKNNGLIKSEAYFNWRYSNYTPKTIRIISIVKDGVQIGYAILKSHKKKGIPFLVLMDLIYPEESYYDELITQCCIYATKNFFSGILLFESSESSNKKHWGITMKDRFNLLVKGKSPELTNSLSKIKYSFLFGDLDIL